MFVTWIVILRTILIFLTFMNKFRALLVVLPGVFDFYFGRLFCDLVRYRLILYCYSAGSILP